MKRRIPNEERIPSFRLVDLREEYEDHYQAHLISVVGGDTQISAISAAISVGDRFMVEGPDVQPIRVCLERNAQCFKASIQPSSWRLGSLNLFIEAWRCRPGRQ